MSSALIDSRWHKPLTASTPSGRQAAPPYLLSIMIGSNVPRCPIAHDGADKERDHEDRVPPEHKDDRNFRWDYASYQALPSLVVI